MKRDEIDSDLSLGMDMIAPEGFGEIVGGGQREENLDTLIDRIRHHDLPLEPFKWYLDLRKYGSVPHSGFGLGLERTVAWICGTKHIRETIPFPRTMSRLEHKQKDSVNLSICQINPSLGDFKSNKEKILKYIYKSKDLSSDIIIFPELAICGYPPWI